VLQKGAAYEKTEPVKRVFVSSWLDSDSEDEEGDNGYFNMKKNDDEW
jgi:hypothetical protein